MGSTSLDKNRSVSVSKEPSLSLSQCVPDDIEVNGGMRAKRDNEYTDWEPLQSKYMLDTKII